MFIFKTGSNNERENWGGLWAGSAEERRGIQKSDTRNPRHVPFQDTFCHILIVKEPRVKIFFYVLNTDKILLENFPQFTLHEVLH